MRELKPEERLIINADFEPGPELGLSTGGTFKKRINWVMYKVLNLAWQLRNTGVCLRVDSALRACGYGLIDKIHDCGLSVFADLKLTNTKETISIDGILLKEAKPDMLTVMCATGIAAMQAIKAKLQSSEILGVTVLPNITQEEAKIMFACSIEKAVLRFAEVGAIAKIDGLVSSAQHLEILRKKFGLFFSLNTLDVRPSWSIVKVDYKNPAIITPYKAIMAGADRMIVSEPITQSKDPYRAVMQTIEEIAKLHKKHGV